MSTIKTNQIQHTANGAVPFTIPGSDGSAGQFMKTDGSGTLSSVSYTHLTLPTSDLV